ncbi:hypothetical protein PLESTM_000375700 [Pleodorina starrii]|nr:hypothetical protein PLESTM_000375700 [Pleodorina starrii]
MASLDRLVGRLLLYTGFAALAIATLSPPGTTTVAAAAAAGGGGFHLGGLAPALRVLLAAADGGSASSSGAAAPPPPSPAGPFVLDPLPYSYDALEPVISAEIMQLHHDVHEAGYVSKANAAGAKLLQQQQQQADNSTATAAAADSAANLTDAEVRRRFAPFLGAQAPGDGTLQTVAGMDGAVILAPKPMDVANMSLTEMLMQVGRGSLDPAFEESIRNNGGGHWNHQLFWKVMATPNSTNTSRASISPQLQQAISDAFGSVDDMLASLKDAGDNRFGSGWAWVCLAEDGKLQVLSTPNQDNPLMAVVLSDPCVPILGLDVWEHAYYLQYKPKRGDYTSAWLSIINWNQVSANYDAARRGDPASIATSK